MRLIDIRGHSMELSQIPTGNMLWVDQVNGNDSIGVRGRRVVPFKTLGAAKGAASAGDTIAVLPGVYNENDLAKDEVNWHFLAGASVEYSGAVDKAIFDSSSVSGGAEFKVTGSGVFKTSVTANEALFLNQSADNVKFEFDTIDTKGNGIHFQTGTLHARGNRVQSEANAISTEGTPGSSDRGELDILEVISTSNTVPAINCDGSRLRLKCLRVQSVHNAVAVTSDAELYLDAQDISSTDATAVDINGSTAIVEIRASSIYADSENGVEFAAASYAQIEALRITSHAGRGVLYDSYGSDPLHLFVGRIVSEYLNSAGQAVYVESGSGGLVLHGCNLIVDTNTGGPSASIDAASSTNVVAARACAGNKAKGTNITFQVSTSFAVDSTFVI